MWIVGNNNIRCLLSEEFQTCAAVDGGMERDIGVSLGYYDDEKLQDKLLILH
jgi:hypothetical protein